MVERATTCCSVRTATTGSVAAPAWTSSPAGSDRTRSCSRKEHVDSIMGAASMDVIMDFQKGQDKIDLTALDPSLGNLLILNNQNVDGANYSYVGLDYDH